MDLTFFKKWSTSNAQVDDDSMVFSKQNYDCCLACNAENAMVQSISYALCHICHSAICYIAITKLQLHNKHKHTGTNHKPIRPEPHSIDIELHRHFISQFSLFVSLSYRLSHHPIAFTKITSCNVITQFCMAFSRLW